MGNLPTPGARPSGGFNTRPGGINSGNVANRPATRPGGGDFRPGSGAGGGRPSAGDLDKFLNIGGSGGGGRPNFGTGAAAAGGALAGGAAAEFLRDNPGRFPGGGGEGGRPGAGDMANNTRPARPGQGGSGEFRPGQGTRPGQGGGGEQRPGRPGEGGSGERPGRPGQGGDGDRPGRPGDGGDRPGRPGDGNRPSRPGQGGSGEQWKPGDGRPNGPDRPNRPGQGGSGERWRPGNRPDRIPDWNQWSNWRNDHHNNVWNDWHNNWNNNWHNCNHWYNNDWWNHNHWHYPYYPNFNYWGWAAWPAVTGWVDYGWSQPVSYNYGDNVYYSGDQVYYGDQPVATTTEYAQQAAAIASNVPTAEPAATDWMPLGVFAVTHDGEPTGAEPTMFLQLAVSKQGVINGTWQNTSTDDSQQIEGMVDKQTQRAAWTPDGKSWPVMETGIVNLTQDTTPALVHFEDGSTQQWLLVRLDKPKDGAAPATSK